MFGARAAGDRRAGGMAGRQASRYRAGWCSDWRRRVGARARARARAGMHACMHACMHVRVWATRSRMVGERGQEREQYAMKWSCGRVSGMGKQRGTVIAGQCPGRGPKCPRGGRRAAMGLPYVLGSGIRPRCPSTQRGENRTAQHSLRRTGQVGRYPAVSGMPSACVS